MKTIIQVLDAVLTRALILLMLFLVGAVLWQVISRYVFASPSSWTEEIARFLLIWIALLGAVYALRTGMHLGLDILPKKLTGQSRRLLKIFTLLMVLMFTLAVLVVGGGNLVMLTWELRQYSAVLGLPMAFVYSVIPVSGVLICCYTLAAFSDDDIGTPHEAVTGGE